MKPHEVLGPLTICELFLWGKRHFESFIKNSPEKSVVELI